MASSSSARSHVPVRTILTTIGLVIAAAIALLVVVQLRRVLVWMLIAAFFAVALSPLVGRLERRVGGRRWLATLLVFLAGLVLISGLVALFVVPLVREGTDLAKNGPEYYQQIKSGNGAIGELATKLHVRDYVANNADKIKQAASGLGAPALHVVRAAAETVAGVVTIFVLAYLMVLEGPRLTDAVFNAMPEPRRSRVRRVASDCARTVTGYLSGNLLISLICGVLTFAVLAIMHVPYAGLIALFVAVADLIPLIGATLGAVVAVIAGFVHSVPAGIVVAVFFIAYQQLENHLLQPVILSRTVKLNPLAVLVAILCGVELAGILGALLAIPVAGVIQVILRDVYDHRRGQLKEEPTIGADEDPAYPAGTTPGITRGAAPGTAPEAVRGGPS